MGSIRIAIIGIGNCASSLVQGLEHYREGANDLVGLMHWEMGGYRPSDIKVVAAWTSTAARSARTWPRRSSPSELHRRVRRHHPGDGTVVKMGAVLDGVADHMADYKDDRTFIVANDTQPSKADVVAELKRRGPRC